MTHANAVAQLMESPTLYFARKCFLGHFQCFGCSLISHFYDISTFMTPKLVGTYNLIQALLDYKRHKTRTGELGIAVPLSEPANIENQVGNNQASGSGRARAMQGWHSQRLLDWTSDSNAIKTLYFGR
ncbi:hypothetical protein Dimus_031500 [Dionaea muscipula]